MNIDYPIFTERKSQFQNFVQLMANRIMQGEARYGSPRRYKNYLKRVKLEIAKYEETGNMENLINAANYLHLESCEPWNKKFHFDNTVDSATRGKVGRNEHHQTVR
jgi:hypothetical protein